MWWKKLWCPALTVGLFWAAIYSSGPINKLEVDRWNRRFFSGHDKSMMYLRDIHLTGDTYVISGLDTISEAD
uniref:Uncharacterized protein n=1 Tax=Meloidogyne javanica TaxID=6303 RepID=A0A915N258_MELJA